MKACLHVRSLHHGKCQDVLAIAPWALQLIMQYLRLVGRAKCHQQINRENILSLGKQSLAGILIISDYPPTSAINIFSKKSNLLPMPSLVFSKALSLSLSLSLSLHYLALSPQLLVLYLTM
jgi:hypothetical protein